MAESQESFEYNNESLKSDENDKSKDEKENEKKFTRNIFTKNGWHDLAKTDQENGSGDKWHWTKEPVETEKLAEIICRTGVYFAHH